MGPSPRRTTIRERKAKAQTAAVQSNPEEIPYRFVSPESGSIVEACYDPQTRTLTITFKTATYDYARVDESLWREFLMAESKGRYFQALIRPFYVGVKR